MSTLVVAAQFTQSTGQPATGLALASIDLYLTRVHNTTGVDSVVWDGTQNPTVEIDNVGSYARLYTDADLHTYTYFCMAQYTGATVLDRDYVMGAVGTYADVVWNATTRTLTTATGAAYTANDGGKLTIHRGETMSVTLTGLGDLSARSKLWFTLKGDKSQADSAAIIMIEETAGLVYLNGADASARSANGSITVDDEDDGDITVTLVPAEADDLAVTGGLFYDVQMLTSAGAVSTLTADAAAVTADVTRAVA